VLSALGFSVLRRLSDGRLHSGEALAAATGVTRARVSQLLQDAAANGLKLERVRGRGYRLLDALPFLDHEAVRIALGRLGVQLALEVVDTIDSTSSELARRAARLDVHRHALAAEWQTAGRGRRGRSWTAVPGGSLTFSLGWRFEQGAGYLSGLTLAAGLGVAQALESAGIKGIELKWPNDLVHGRAKLGGILVELSGDALGPSLAIIGVGINVRLSPDARRAIGQRVTDLASLPAGGSLDRNLLLARLLDELGATLEAYAAAGFGPLRAAWQRRHALQGQSVRIQLPDGGTARGRVVGVDADGALVLDDAGRRLRFVSGEVSLTRRTGR
jgi:BirA family transcriptional regulator, biotin operon repressor / biotin---[acetyl-CoA-carboxylase] ligase